MLGIHPKDHLQGTCDLRKSSDRKSPGNIQVNLILVLCTGLGKYEVMNNRFLALDSVKVLGVMILAVHVLLEVKPTY